MFEDFNNGNVLVNSSNLQWIAITMSPDSHRC